VFATALARDETEPALRKGIGCTYTAEVDYRGQFSLMLRIRLRVKGKNPSLTSPIRALLET